MEFFQGVVLGCDEGLSLSQQSVVGASIFAGQFNQAAGGKIVRCRRELI